MTSSCETSAAASSSRTRGDEPCAIGPLGAGVEIVEAPVSLRAQRRMQSNELELLHRHRAIALRGVELGERGARLGVVGAELHGSAHRLDRAGSVEQAITTKHAELPAHLPRALAITHAGQASIKRS